MDPAKELPEVVGSYIQSKLKEDRLVGPLDAVVAHIHTSPFGVILKSGQLSKRETDYQSFLPIQA